MSKYLKLYYFDSVLTILLMILLYTSNFDQVNLLEYSGSAYVFRSVFVSVLISTICLLVTIILNIIPKFSFKEENLLFPKYYLVFFILIIIFGLVFNRFVLVKGIHYMYYFTFIIIGFAMLSIYTCLSFKNDKKKNK